MSITAPTSKAKLGPPPLQTAKVRVLAMQQQVDNTQNSDIDRRILDRIKKCLQRGQHRNTSEAEAQTALRMASRLMAQCNVTQSDLLDETTDNDDLTVLGGESVVDITDARTGSSKVIAQTWVQHVASAIRTFYDCKSYSTRRRTSIEWTFYGIRANTVAAAMAFEMVHNLTLEWARSKTGMNAKTGYCLGIGMGLYQLAREEKKREAKEAREVEKQYSKAQLEAFTTNPDTRDGDGANSTADVDMNVEVTIKDDTGLPDPDSDGDEDEHGDEATVMFNEAEEKPLDLDADFDQQLRDMTPEQMTADSSDMTRDDSENTLTTSPWTTSKALVKFRQSARKIADDYLTTQNIKFGRHRK